MRYTTPDNSMIDGRIPCDPANSDYQDILRRIRDEGLVIEPYVPPPAPTPEEALRRFAHSKLGEMVLAWAAIQCSYSELSPALQAKAGPLRTRLRDLIVAGLTDKINDLP